ncbi:hypothetical protein [Hymenobacter sp. BRD67]|nr:hypothetical protein [Hymenobacter sp. BRD67]QKG53643.1 hypothetical protein GKZ67_14830 [Hymenobacter sp. BRD67]
MLELITFALLQLATLSSPPATNNIGSSGWGGSDIVAPTQTTTSVGGN